MTEIEPENNITCDKKTARWFVMRAYKAEKLAEEKLSCEQGMDYFIPKHYVVRTYHGRQSRRLVPIIPSLVFVHASRAQIAEFKQKYNFLQYVTWRKSSGKDVITIPDEQMEAFMKVASQYEEDIAYCSPDEIDLKTGMRVRIRGGVFDGVEGSLVRIPGKRDKRVVVSLDDVMTVATAEILPSMIEIITDK